MALEANYIAIDGNLGAVGGVVGSACPTCADDDVLCIAAAYDTYGGICLGCHEVKLYRRVFGNGKGDIAAHIRLDMWCTADVDTVGKDIGIVLPVLHLPVFGGSVLFVGGEDGSVI